MTLTYRNNAARNIPFAHATDSNGRQVALVALHPDSSAGASSGALAVDRELVVVIFRCKTTATGMSVGDTITLTQILDVTASPSTVSTVWRNQTTGTDFGTAPSVSNLELPQATGLTNTQLVAAGLATQTTAAAQLAVTPTPVDSTGALLPLTFDYLAEVRTFDGSGNVLTQARSTGGFTYTMTHTYSGNNCTNSSAWVKV